MRLSPIKASGGKRHSHLRGGMQRSASGPSLREEKLDQTYADTCQAFLDNFRRGLVATASEYGTDLQVNRAALTRGKSSLVAPLSHKNNWNGVQPAEPPRHPRVRQPR